MKLPVIRMDMIEMFAREIEIPYKVVDDGEDKGRIVSTNHDVFPMVICAVQEGSALPRYVFTEIEVFNREEASYLHYVIKDHYSISYMTQDLRDAWQKFIGNHDYPRRMIDLPDFLPLAWEWKKEGEKNNE
jgi:hypothetical protein